MKESVEPLEPIVENVEPKIEEKPEPPKKVYELKEIAKCPGCGFEMTQHTLNYIHKRTSFCKAVKTSEPEKNTRTRKNTRTSSTSKTKDYTRYCKWLYEGKSRYC